MAAGKIKVSRGAWSKIWGTFLGDTGQKSPGLPSTVAGATAYKSETWRETWLVKIEPIEVKVLSFHWVFNLILSSKCSFPQVNHLSKVPWFFSENQRVCMICPVLSRRNLTRMGAPRILLRRGCSGGAKCVCGGTLWNLFFSQIEFGFGFGFELWRWFKRRATE